MDKKRHWCVGVDRASETHQVRVSEARGGKLGERGFRVHAINPKQLDRFRDRFSPAGAEDDSRDAELLADALRIDPRCFRRLAPLDALVIELREWSRIAEDLTRERTRLANRLREQPWRYNPQILEVTDDLAAAWFLELWSRVPTPKAARRVREDTLAKLRERHRIRRIDAASLIERLHAPAIRVAPGTTEAATAHIKAVAARLALVNRQLDEARRRLDRRTRELAEGGETELGQKAEQRDVTILASLRGIGGIVLATPLAEAFIPPRRRDHHAPRCLCGAAPVTKRFGKCEIVIRRLTAVRSRGQGHSRALRSIADRPLAVACATLDSQTVFHPDHPRQCHAA